MGSGVSLTKWSDLMQKNVTFAYSGKISLRVFMIKILVFTLAASRLNSEVYLFSLELPWTIFAAHWSHKKKRKLNGYNLKSRL